MNAFSIVCCCDDPNMRTVTKVALLDLSICQHELGPFIALITMTGLSGQGLAYSCLVA